MVVVAATSVVGGFLAEVLHPDSISTTFIGICATVLLFVVKELITISSRLSKVEQKLDNLPSIGQQTNKPA